MPTKKATKAPAKTTPKPLTKDEIREALAEATGCTKAAVGQVYDALIDLIAAQVKKNKVFALPGIGKFTVAQRAARIGVNPRKPTEKIEYPAKETIKFSVSKIIKDKVIG